MYVSEDKIESFVQKKAGWLRGSSGVAGGGGAPAPPFVLRRSSILCSSPCKLRRSLRTALLIIYCHTVTSTKVTVRDVVGGAYMPISYTIYTAAIAYSAPQPRAHL